MAALSGLGAIRTRSPQGLIVRQSRPSVTYYQGSLVGRRRGSKLCEVPLSTAPRTDLVIEGTIGTIIGGSFTSSSTTDSGGGAIDSTSLVPQTMSIITAPVGWFDTGTSGNQLTANDIGAPAYAFDSNTVYKTDLNGQLPFAGWVDDVNTAGKIALRFDPDHASETADMDTTVTYAVRCVVTALGAYTASSGTLTVTATGALGTQDGVTVAAGDEVWLPEYAGTANSSVTVSSANSGPYEVVNPGGTGVQAVLRRPKWWTHGGAMPLGASVKIAEGTLFGRSIWDVGAAKGSVIGTDDPAAYPREVIQQVQLTSSAVAITNVPIRAAAKCVATANLVTASSATSTVAYGPIAAATPGPIGTATITIDAIASGQTKNGTSDGSTLNVSIRNQ